MPLKMKNKLAIFLSLLAWASALPAAPSGEPRPAAPDLVLLVVVDQLRGDMPWRFEERFGEGGFRYLIEQGASFRNAQFAHANTITAAGHATLVTGGNPREHGLAANEWFDPERGRPVYCMEDPAYKELTAAGPQEPGVTEGRSPRNLHSSTFGDELVMASGGRSRVFSVSLKDRSAIIMGGRLGKAYWYSKGSGQFVSSTYYHAEQPAWMRDWNAGNPADRFTEAPWELLLDRESYVFAQRDDRPWERPDADLGRRFPHPLAHNDPQLRYAKLRDTPMADELTLDFVRALVAAEQPGRRGATDVLAVSFSATDYIGHAFGPYSLEAEDNLLRLDRTLAALLQLIDREVGLARTLVVLASDHGVAPAPEFAAAQGFEADRHDPAYFMPRLSDALQARFETDEPLLLTFQKPGIWLDSAAVARAGLDLEVVERALAAEVARLPGFRGAYARSDLLAGRITPSAEAQRVAAAFHPARSGNVYVVPEPYWYLDKDPEGNAAMHGTQYPFDTHVPLMLAGPGIGHSEVYREVAPRDLAPTISLYLGIALPTAAVGLPLREVLE